MLEHKLLGGGPQEEVVYVYQASDSLLPQPGHERSQQAGEDVGCIYNVSVL